MPKTTDIIYHGYAYYLVQVFFLFLFGRSATGPLTRPQFTEKNFHTLTFIIFEVVLR